MWRILRPHTRAFARHRTAICRTQTRQLRLLQLRDNNELIITNDLTQDIPPYAILSHTWGHEIDEVTFQDLVEHTGADKNGYQKIVFCGKQAQRDGLRYFWVDTCCINKASSAELSEAINSMFDWYQKAQKCYVYLADVQSIDNADAPERSTSRWLSSFRESRWFTRGWTLQELIAPKVVEFFSSDGERLGDKASLGQIIREITHVPLVALQGSPLSGFPIEERISWSSKRRTSRPEDSVYSLLGLLDVSMPVIYGEGEQRAMDRVQREVAFTHSEKFLATNTMRARGVIKQSHFYLPFPKNQRFTGRDTILQDIQEQLFISKSCQKVAIVGLGGTGKTQIALQLAYWVKESKPTYSVLWIPATNMESFEQAAREIAKRIGVKKETDQEDVKISLRRHLELEENQKWFLVVDNADDTDVLFGPRDSDMQGIYQYLPMSENCIALYTTRSRDIALAVAETDVVELGEMSLEDATSFFAKSTFHKEILKDNETVAELLKELALLPLAIAQAAAYLNRNRQSVKRYLDLLRSTEQDMVRLMSAEFQDNTRYRGSHNAVATTWLVSFDQMRRTDPFAADLLLFISLIEPRGIPRSLLPEAQTEVDTEQAIGTLCGYAFLADRGNEVYDMHKLVHVAAKVWSSKQGIAKTIENALDHVRAIFPTDEPDDRELWRAYMPHAIRLLEMSSNSSIGGRYDLSQRVGICLFKDRRLKEAIFYLEQSYEWGKTYMHEDERLQLELELYLGSAYLDNRQTDKSIDILEHVAQLRRETLDENDYYQLSSKRALASAYISDGRVMEALEILEHVVKVERETLDENDSSRLSSEHTLATAYLSDGRITEAIEILEHVVAVEREMGDENDYYRLLSEQELANAYFNDGRVTEAIEMLEHVVAGMRATLDENDSSRLSAEHTLALAYLKDGQARKAVDLLQHVVGVESHLLDDDDPERQASVDLLANAYEQLKG